MLVAAFTLKGLLTSMRQAVHLCLYAQRFELLHLYYDSCIEGVRCQALKPATAYAVVTTSSDTEDTCCDCCHDCDDCLWCDGLCCLYAYLWTRLQVAYKPVPSSRFLGQVTGRSIGDHSPTMACSTYRKWTNSVATGFNSLRTQHAS